MYDLQTTAALNEQAETRLAVNKNRAEAEAKRAVGRELLRAMQQSTDEMQSGESVGTLEQIGSLFEVIRDLYGLRSIRLEFFADGSGFVEPLRTDLLTREDGSYHFHSTADLPAAVTRMVARLQTRL